MRSTLDYETPPTRSKPRRAWTNALAAVAIGCGFFAAGIAGSAKQVGQLPGEWATASGVLAATSLVLAGLAIRRTFRAGRGADFTSVVACGCIAAGFSALAIWNLAHCRW